MKKAALLTIAIISVSLSFAAAPIITALANNNNWKNASSWTLARKPQDGDTVIIPTGVTLIIDNNQDYHNQFLYLKIYGTLMINSGARFKLNSASSIIVFTGGTIDANGAAPDVIQINGITKLKGNDADIAGPEFADNTTGSSPTSGFSFFSPLPVKFVGFNVARQNNNVLVQWTTAEEMNSRYFEVQRSENGIDWTTISNITAAGNTSANHSYSYTDKNIISKLAYYRIRQVDMDGKFSLTPVRMIKNEAAVAEVKITAASSNSIYIHFSGQVKGNVVILLTTSNGQVVSQKTFDSPIGQVIIPVQNSNKGIYIVTVTDGQELKFSKQVLL